MYESLKDALVVLVRVLWPFCNASTREVIGTIVSVLAALVAALTWVIPQVPSAPPVPVQTPMHSPAPVAPPAVDVPPAPDAGPVTMWHSVGVGALAIAAAVLPVGCAAITPQTKTDLAKAGIDVGSCLAQCGLTAAVDAGRQEIQVGSVNGPGLGQDAVNCAVACASSAGLKAIVELAADLAQRAMWFGTASSEYARPAYRVRLVQR